MTKNEILRVKAALDEQGNGLFPSDTAITIHNGIPLTDYLNEFEKEIETRMKKPEGFNQIKNIIECPSGTDPHDLNHTGYYACDLWKEGTVPVLTVNSIMRLEQSLTNSKRLEIFYPSSENIYEDVCNDGIWSGWREPRKEEHTGITFMNGWIANGHPPIITKIGNIVLFNAILRNGTTAVNTIIGSVPRGYRPCAVVLAAIMTQAGNGICAVLTNGDIRIDIAPPTNNTIQITSMWKL